MYLQHYLRQLNEAINLGKEGIDYVSKLQTLQNLLKRNQYHCCIQVEEKVWPCTRCGNACDFENSFELYCGHLLCSVACLQALIEDCTAGDLEDYHCVLCPDCSEPVGRNYILLACGGEEGFRQRLQENCEKREPRMDCEICYEALPVSSLVTLTCEHRYCAECIRNYLTFNINEGKVAEDILVCPTDKKPIDVAIIKASLLPEDYARFERFRLNQWEYKDLDLIQFRCHGIDCEYMALAQIHQQSVTCPVCKLEACPNCNLPPHPGKTCELMQRLAQAKEDVEGLGDLMRQPNMFRCPYCRTVIEKKGGCKYMTCTSQQCRGKGHFCSHCMTKLPKRHGVHDCVTPDILRRRLCAIF